MLIVITVADEDNGLASFYKPNQFVVRDFSIRKHKNSCDIFDKVSLSSRKHFGFKISNHFFGLNLIFTLE